MEKSPLTLRFTPEPEDYVKASRTLAMNSKTFFIMGGLLLVGMLASIVVLLLPSIENPAWKNMAMIFVVVSGFYVIYYFFIIPFQLKQAYKKQEHLKTDREITFKDKQISIKIGEGGISLDWENLEQVIEVKDFYLMVFKDQKKIYFFIPGRAFDQDVSKDDFLEALKAKSIQIS